MKHFVVLFSSFLLLTHCFSQQPFADFDYLDPLPNARFVSTSSTIIIRPKNNIDINTLLNNGSVIVQSFSSGIKTFTGRIADEGKVVLLKMTSSFNAGDSVLMQFTSHIKYKNGAPINSFGYKFYLSKTQVSDRKSSTIEELYPEFDVSNNASHTELFSAGVPEIIVTYSRFPSPGKLFFNNLVRFPVSGYTPYLLVTDNEGTSVFKREMPAPCYDLNLQPNGMITYFDQLTDKFYGLNSNLEIADTFHCGNGYVMDLHELRILPNGNYLVMSYDIQFMDDIGIGSPGKGNGPPSVRVVGVIVQELDQNNDVVFQWRSWDHFLITDATHENFGASTIDYCHANAIEVDIDGHLLLSSRNMDEITKINRITGNTIWRLGGKNNQFTFINDTIGFSHQHAIRRISNGNITLYDNGNYHTPPFSRAVEYRLDEVNKTAELVWQYRNTPDIYAPATGYVQRLPNNNTLICWGLTNPTLTEVRYDGTKVLEMTMPQGVFSYRAYKYEWQEGPNSEILPLNYGLMQNYPNPFNPSTTIKFKIPSLGSESAQVSAVLKVYDVSGKEIEVLVNENFPPGTYSVKFDASGFASGIYFYKITIGDFSESRKMVLVK
jgi:hypothetical protein